MKQAGNVTTDRIVATDGHATPRRTSGRSDDRPAKAARRGGTAAGWYAWTHTIIAPTIATIEQATRLNVTRRKPPCSGCQLSLAAWNPSPK